MNILTCSTIVKESTVPLVIKHQFNSKSNFKDVPDGNWAYDYVSAAFEGGIIKGYEDGTFKPNGRITRAEIAVMLSRAFDLVDGDTVKDFNDVPTGNWSFDAIRNLSSNDIIKGYKDGKFKPNNLVTRAEFATMLYRLFGVIEK